MQYSSWLQQMGRLSRGVFPTNEKPKHGKGPFAVYEVPESNATLLLRPGYLPAPLWGQIEYKRYMHGFGAEKAPVASAPAIYELYIPLPPLSDTPRVTESHHSETLFISSLRLLPRDIISASPASPSSSLHSYPRSKSVACRPNCVSTVPRFLC